MRSPFVLVTGARGYLGGRIAAYVRGTGLTLRLGSRARPLHAPPGVDVVAMGELTQPAVLDVACDGVSHIVHLAALNEIDSERDPARAIDVNVTGTLRLLEAARRSGVRRFLYLSTAHVYGAPLVGVLTERSPTRPVHPYAITHRAAEDFVFGEASRGGLEPVVIRLSNAVGAPASATVERWTLLVNDLSRQIVVDGRMTLRSAGLQQRDFIPMTDVCRAIAHLLEQPAERLQDGLFNLGGGRSLQVIDVAQRLAARAEALLGFLPEIARPAPRDGESAPTLDYRIDKLLGSGFSLEGDLDRELEDTLRFCQAAFGAGRAGGDRMAPPSASAHG